MLKRFAERLFAPPVSAGAPPSEDRVPLATCVVLLEAARIDDEFTDAERRHILDVVQKRFDLTREEAKELMHEATEAREESSDLWRFTHEINKGFSKEEKLHVIEEVWRIFFSDGSLDGHEDHLAHKLRKLLNLNHPQLIEAKMKVLKEVRGE